MVEELSDCGFYRLRDLTSFEIMNRDELADLIYDAAHDAASSNDEYCSTTMARAVADAVIAFMKAKRCITSSVMDFELAFTKLLSDLSETWAQCDIDYIQNIISHAEYGDALENIIAIGQKVNLYDRHITQITELSKALGINYSPATNLTQNQISFGDVIIHNNKKYFVIGESKSSTQQNQIIIGANNECHGKDIHSSECKLEAKGYHDFCRLLLSTYTDHSER